MLEVALVAHFQQKCDIFPPPADGVTWELLILGSQNGCLHEHNLQANKNSRVNVKKCYKNYNENFIQGFDSYLKRQALTLTYSALS